MSQSPLITIAVPKGRILDDLLAAKRLPFTPEAEFFSDSSRRLIFATDRTEIRLVRVRSFDAATFVAHGGAELGICGYDVLREFDYAELYAPVDLGIGHCRLSLAAPEALADSFNMERLSHIRVATKYPGITRRFFAERGIQAECIKLNGAMELAPSLGLANYIVDLVDSGRTLKANGLREITTLLTVSARLIVNRAALKTRGGELQGWVDAFHNNKSL